MKCSSNLLAGPTLGSLTKKADGRPKKVCTRCGSSMPRMKKLYCSSCSDIVFDERKAQAQVRYAAARKAYQGRNA